MKKKKKKQWESLIENYRSDGIAGCSHFPQCGGCFMQDIPYDKQLDVKRDYFNSIFEGVAEADRIFSSEPYGYRNRMDYVCAFGRIGLREAGRYKTVIDIHSCPINQEKSDKLFNIAREAVAGIEDYDYLHHSGYLRYIITRQGFFSGETMLSFVVASRDSRLNSAVEKLSALTDSVNIIFNDGMADLSFGEVIESYKKNYIEEVFDGIKYRIRPNSFFQSNSRVALEVYRRIRENVNGKVLDLYSGVGSISLFAAEKAESVTGVEFVEEAVESAKENSSINGINNVKFICDDSHKYVKENGIVCDTLVLDPPRSGMHPKLLKLINECGPERIIYMSCNPSVFRLELDMLTNYKVKSFDLFDMFPQTPHMESLSVIERV